jgi:hypothetical protein
MNEELMRFRQGSQGKRYTAEQKAFAMRYASMRGAEGARRGQVVRELGVSAVTLRSWQRQEHGSEAGLLRPVVLRRAAASHTGAVPACCALVVHGPCGLRIEGLGVVQLAALCRELTGC